MDLSGQRIRKYEIEKLLGTGGMGSVYKARDTILERDVALKVLSPTLANDDSFVERFRLEARALARLDHPGIVKVFDADWADNRLFLVMEFVEGGSLADLIQAEGALSPPLVVKLLKQVASGLDYAHQRGLVHRDIKPANILLDTQGNARITDFGLVKESETNLTADGMRLGTPAYMAPEQIQGMEVTPAMDIYALGVVAYEMLTGHPPFTGTMSKVFEGHLLGEPPPLTEANPSLPAAVQNVMQRVLAKDPADRYPSATAFVDALEEALETDERGAALVGEMQSPFEAPESGPQAVSGGVRAPSGTVSPSGASSGVRPAGKKGGGFLAGLGLGVAGLILLGVVALVCVGGAIVLLASGSANATPAPAVETPIATLPQSGFVSPAPPTLPPAQSVGVLFEDDFSTRDAGWPSSRDEDGIVDYDQGGYRIRVDKTNWLFWATAGLTFSDVSVEVEATRIGGPEVNEFGVICRYVDEDNFYYFVITSDGFYAIFRYVDNESDFIGMNDYRPTDAVNQGAATNRIRAVCQGDTLRLFVNDQLVADVQDGAHAAGDIGLIAGTFDEPGTDVLFDNLVVREP